MSNANTRSLLIPLLIASLMLAGQQSKTTPKKKSPARRTVATHPAAKKKAVRRRKPAGPPVKPLPPPEPIHVAIENKDDALGPFYRALAALTESDGSSKVVRILHFGDSHVAADIWTRDLRTAFQSRFGDAGPGLVLPGSVFRGYRRSGVSVHAPVKTWQGITLRAPGDDGLLGLPGAALRGKASAGDATATARFTDFELQVAAPSGETPCAEVTMEDESVAVDREQVGPLLILRNHDPLPLAMHTLKAAACDDGTTPVILGLDLRTGQSGIIYDSFGINGVQLADLEKIPSPLRRELIARLHPNLIIVSYGTNDMGRKGLSLESYTAECIRLLRELRADAGDVPVLVTGPIDRPGRSLKTRDYFHERSDIVIEALRSAAGQTGCAFWDARAAMGGFGSLLRWRRSSLAQPDLVHLTGTGYELLAKMLAGELMP